jgi:hypothetical protein
VYLKHVPVVQQCAKGKLFAIDGRPKKGDPLLCLSLKSIVLTNLKFRRNDTERPHRTDSETALVVYNQSSSGHCDAFNDCIMALCRADLDILGPRVGRVVGVPVVVSALYWLRLCGHGRYQ